MKTLFSVRPSVQPATAGVFWPARVFGMLAWLLAGYTVVFWVLQWGVATPVGGLAPPPVTLPEVDSATVARALGGGQSNASVAKVTEQPGLAQRVQLQGVLARAGQAKEEGPGVALLAVDGQKARPYALGAVVDGLWVVRKVEARAVVLAPQTNGGETGGDVRLEMPAQSNVQIIQKR